MSLKQWDGLQGPGPGPGDASNGVHAQQATDAEAFKLKETSPFERNIQAVLKMELGDLPGAIGDQREVVAAFTSQIGSTSDAYLDIAGSINDLGVMLMLSEEYEAANKQFKRDD